MRCASSQTWPGQSAGRAVLLHAGIGPLADWGFPADRLAASLWPAYVNQSWLAWHTLGKRPGLVFVDGRFRLACCLSAVVALGAGRSVGECSRVLLHDFDAARRFYAPMLQFLEIEETEGTLHPLRIRVDASPIGALAGMLAALTDPR